MLCPTCERQCDDAEEVCLRCHTALRERVVVMDSPAEQPSTGKSYTWIWGVLALMVVGSFVRGCAQAVREPQPQAQAVPADPEAAYRSAFVRDFNASCLKRGNPRSFCDCAGPKLLENLEAEEMEGVVESMKNGRPDVRVSTIILQCSK